MRLFALVFTTMALALSVGSAFAASHAASITIPKYTVVSVILDETISTKTNKTGDKFEVHCEGTNCGGFPSGTTFVGVLTAATPAKGHQPGTGSAEFTQAILPDGRKIQILAEPGTAEGVRTGTKTGGVSKGKSKETRVALRAGIGALTGGVRSALMGGAVGAVTGKTGKDKGKDIEIKAGTNGHILMLKSVTIPAPPRKSSGKG